MKKFKNTKSKEKLYFQEIRLPSTPPSRIMKSKKDKQKYKKDWRNEE